MIVELFLWIIGILLSIVLTIILTDPINFLIAQIIGGRTLRKKRITGVWKAIWWYETDSKKYSYSQFYKIKQFGNYVVANSFNDEINSTVIKAKMDNNTFLTGTWVGKFLKDEGRYHGALQFLIYPTGNKLFGKWVGFDRNHKIREGDWEWIYVKSQINENELEKFKSEETIELKRNTTNINNGGYIAE